MSSLRASESRGARPPWLVPAARKSAVGVALAAAILRRPAGDGQGGVIVIGGIMPSGHANSLEHTATDSAGRLLGWTPLGPVPTGSVAAIGARNAVYVFGGLVGQGTTLRPTADVWRAPLL